MMLWYGVVMIGNKKNFTNWIVSFVSIGIYVITEFGERLYEKDCILKTYSYHKMIDNAYEYSP